MKNSQEHRHRRSFKLLNKQDTQPQRISWLRSKAEKSINLKETIKDLWFLLVPNGVANLFDKIHLSGFLAIVMKHIVNLKYFFDIRSGYYMFQYLMHEFFHIKDDRNVTRGHSSRYGNVLWSVPLRIFYGLVWFVEASKNHWEW